GRGFWILDDVTPLRQLSNEVLRSSAHLFAPRPAYRFNTVAAPVAVPTSADGFDPEYGAAINYYLADARPGGVTVRIADSTGVTIRTLRGARNRGINRIHWDLEHEPLPPAQLRTPPLGHPDPMIHGPVRLRYNDEGWRPYGAQNGPRVRPGTFTVTLEVDGRRYTQPLEVRKDPNSAGTVADIRAQNELSFQVRENLLELNAMVDALEWIRTQIGDLRQRHGSNTQQASVLQAAAEFERKATELEGTFIRLQTTDAINNGLRMPSQLRDQFSGLYGRIVGSLDFPPTQPMHGFYQEILPQLAERKREYEAFMRTDFANFNQIAQRGGVATIDIPGAQPRLTEVVP
ncbi:MAG: hypothetical protein HY701_12975, partial [Gemmatimonadetes bacterium]|nr:hypothetical protein [Gemmatimonadota bacterium]